MSAGALAFTGEPADTYGTRRAASEKPHWKSHELLIRRHPVTLGFRDRPRALLSVMVIGQALQRRTGVFGHECPLSRSADRP